ncbi:MAG TPA: MFS transporter [Planctomycetota bacterium]|nr:MFS transporter [Planctomycetota bacterium]
MEEPRQGSSPISAGSAAEKPTYVRFKVLGFAASLALVAYVHRVGFASVGTDVRGDLALDERQWSTVHASFLVAYALFEMPWGRLGDRMGTRHLLTIMALGWSLMTALTAWLGAQAPEGSKASFLALVLLRFLFGAFQAGAFPAISRVVADWMPLESRATAQGLIWMSSRIGGAAAPLVLIPMVNSGMDWTWALALVSTAGIAWSLAFWPWFRDRPGEMRSVNAAERERIATGRASHSAAHGAMPWKLLFGSRSVWFLCLMYGCSGFSASFFVTGLPDYLRTHRGLTPDEMKWATSLPLAFGIAACLAGGIISDWVLRRTGSRRWSRSLIGLVGAAGAGLALFSTNLVEEKWQLGVLLCLSFVLFDFTMGPAWAACADIGERHAGILGGAMNMFGSLGGAAGALFAGTFLGQEIILPLSGRGGEALTVAGNDIVFAGFACSFWLAALLWLGVNPARSLEGEARE